MAVQHLVLLRAVGMYGPSLFRGLDSGWPLSPSLAEDIDSFSEDIVMLF